MEKITYLILILFFSLSSITFSQEVTKGQPEPVKELPRFIIKPKFPTNVAFHFKRTEKTKVTQSFSDSSKRVIERNYDLYFTYYSPSKPDKGVTKLIVSIDSLTYSFKIGKDSIYYNSQDDKLVPPLSRSDYDANSAILGKEFNFYYSPYWDFGKIDGKRIDEVRRYINDPSDGILDTLRNYYWNYRLSDDYLTNIVDILKGFIPNSSIDSSTILKVPFKIDIEEIQLFDSSAKVKLTETTSQLYKITGKINNLKNVKHQIRIFGFDRLVDIVNCSGSGEYELLITPQGRIDGSNSNFKVNLLLKDRKELINEQIEEVINYQLLRNYKI
jgi:hypothetical protein